MGGASPTLLFATHSVIEYLIVSAELKALYFRSKERLTNEAPPISRTSEHAGDTLYDLYRYDVPGEHLSFVVQTSSESNFVGSSTSPDGNFHYWGSEGVAGVPGGKLVGGGNSVQVYRYDNAENVVQCMSCASPSDPEPKLKATFMPEGVLESPDSTPDSTVSSANGDYVFFDTAAALVPQDVDGEIPTAESNGLGQGEEEIDRGFSQSSDVYEWRKDGWVVVRMCRVVWRWSRRVQVVSEYVAWYRRIGPRCVYLYPFSARAAGQRYGGRCL